VGAVRVPERADLCGRHLAGHLVDEPGTQDLCTTHKTQTHTHTHTQNIHTNTHTYLHRP
jgi:hypothetical protein